MIIYLSKKKKILIGSVFNNKNEYYPQVSLEEYFYECKKCFDILIMNATSKNNSKNEKIKNIKKKTKKKILKKGST